MPTRTHTKLLLGVVAALATLPQTACTSRKSEPEPIQFERQEWQFGPSAGSKLITEHYVISTTIKDEVLLDAIPDFMESAYARYVKLLPPLQTPDKRMRVYLFAERIEWEAFTRKLTGSRSQLYLQVRNGGYSERGVAVIEYVAHQVTFPLLAHEGFHQYLFHHVSHDVPAWLNEGFAVLCEGQRWGAAKVQSFDPWFNPRRRNAVEHAVATNRLHSLRKLLETHPGQVIQETSRAVSTYYAQVWALVLFLREGEDGKYDADFQRLLDKLHEVDLEQYARAAHIWSERGTFNFGEALFRTFISEDLDTVEQEYFEFLRQRF